MILAVFLVRIYGKKAPELNQTNYRALLPPVRSFRIPPICQIWYRQFFYHWTL